MTERDRMIGETPTTDVLAGFNADLPVVKGATSWRGRWQQYLPAILAFIVVILLWEGLTRLLRVETFVLPKPSEVMTSFFGTASVIWGAGYRTLIEALGGFVIGARMVDKAWADLLGIHGEYNFFPCGLGAYFWKFTGLDAPKFKDFVATGASDAEMDEWIRRNAVVKDKQAVIRWNNEMVGLRLCDLTYGVQEFFSTYIPQFCKPASKVKFFFDVYDVEEGVL